MRGGGEPWAESPQRAFGDRPPRRRLRRSEVSRVRFDPGVRVRAGGGARAAPLCREWAQAEGGRLPAWDRAVTGTCRAGPSSGTVSFRNCEKTNFCRVAVFCDSGPSSVLRCGRPAPRVRVQLAEAARNPPHGSL